MKKKRCGNCFADVQSTAIYCPHCRSVDGWLPTPQGGSRESLTEIWSPEKESTNTSSAPEQSPQDLSATRRVLVDESLGEEKVAQYRARLAEEIEEIRYQQWRDIQPEWQKVVRESQAKNSVSPFQNPALTTAAGVIMGTTAMRYQLGVIQNELEAQNPDTGSALDTGGDSAGFFDGF